jgi:hypothetical protein
MATIIADRVRDTTTWTFSPFTLSGTPPTKYRTFSAVCAVGDTVDVFFRHQTVNQWQVATCTYSATNQLTLGTVYASSNAGAAVTFSNGVIDVVLDVPAAKRVLTNLPQTLTNKTIGTPAAVGDANYTILATDAFVYTTAALTTARVWTLPTAAAYGAGKPLTVADVFGTVGVTNTITIQRAGSDTINGLVALVMGVIYQSLTLESDGVSKWSITAGSPSATYSTGDLKPTHKNNADPGWILWSDGTIGNAGSGAGIRALGDASDLFSLYYNGYSDADCPLLTTAGGATTRAANSSWPVAFYTNLCRITLPRGAGRSLNLAGSGSGLTARGLGAIVGAETETPTIAKTANHQHNYDWIVTLATGQSGAGIGGWSSLATGTTGSGNSTGTTNLNILNPSAYINVMIKL